MGPSVRRNTVCPGVTNQVADAESRVTADRLDWKLSVVIFQKINAIWGPLEVDLFATRLFTQLVRFFSWRPDPLAEATNAFQQDWVPLKAYANPPWCLIGKVLNGPSLEKSTMVSSSSGDAMGFSSVDSLVQRPFSDDL